MLYPMKSHKISWKMYYINSIINDIKDQISFEAIPIT